MDGERGDSSHRYLEDYLDSIKSEYRGRAIAMKKKKKTKPKPLNKLEKEQKRLLDQQIEKKRLERESISLFFIRPEPRETKKMVEEVKTQFEDQQELFRKCDRDDTHPTEIFKAQSGKLFWRCTHEDCKEKSGAWAGKFRLLGADGEAPRVKRVRPEPDTSTVSSYSFTTGTHVSLAGIAQSLERIEQRQKDMEKKLELLDSRFTSVQQ
jgi:hypothetical protein